MTVRRDDFVFSLLGALATGLAGAFIGCSAGSPTEIDRVASDGVAVRASAVVVEGCAVDTSAGSTLASAAARRVLGEVIVHCASLDDAGNATPAQGDPTLLRAQIRAIHALGYRVTLGARLSLVDGSEEQIRAIGAMRSNARWAIDVARNLWALAADADEVDVAFPASQLDFGDAPRLRAFTTALQRATPSLGPARTVGLFVPPSTRSPSDVAGGDAYDVAYFQGAGVRVRLMTLDFSCCGAQVGPTTDPGWTVDVARFAQAPLDPSSRVDVAYPLYGTDFSQGHSKSIGYADVTAAAAAAGAAITRGPTGALSTSYVDGFGATHIVWFDDAASTLMALRAWNGDVLSPRIGVVFYGLGAEDPTLWDALDRAQNADGRAR